MRFGLSSLVALVGLAAVSSAALAEDPAVKVGGSLELNYTYNFNRPGADNAALGYTAAPGNRTGYYFNRKESEFALNLAEINITREATKDSKLGFALRIIDGEAAKQLAANTVPGATPSKGNITSSSVVNLYEASLHELLTDKLSVDAGVFPTWVGYETIPMGTSSFLSKSFHYGQFQPIYHQGAKANYAFSDKTTVTGAVVNAYNGTDKSPTSRDLGLGFQVAHTLSKDAKVYLNGLSGRDLGIAGAKHDIFNVVYSNQLNEKNSVALDASYTTSGPSGGRTKGYAYTGYLTHAMENGNAVALRGEYLTEDRAGGALLAFGGTKKPSVSSITASYELKKADAKGLRTLVEYRLDQASASIFPTRGGTKKNQSTLSVVQVVSF